MEEGHRGYRGKTIGNVKIKSEINEPKEKLRIMSYQIFEEVTREWTTDPR